MAEDLFEEEAVFVAVPDEDGQVQMLEGRSEFEASIAPAATEDERKEFKPRHTTLTAFGLIVTGFVMLVARFSIKKQPIEQSMTLFSHPSMDEDRKMPSFTAAVTTDSTPVSNEDQILVAFYNPLHPAVRNRWDVWEDSARVVNAFNLSPRLAGAAAVDCVMEENLCKRYGIDVQDLSTFVWIKLLPDKNLLKSSLLSSEGHQLTGPVDDRDFQSLTLVRRIMAKHDPMNLPFLSSSTSRVSTPTLVKSSLDMPPLPSHFEAHASRSSSGLSLFNEAKALVEVNKVSRALQLISSKQLTVHGVGYSTYSDLIPVGSTRDFKMPRGAGEAFLKRRIARRGKTEKSAFISKSLTTRMHSSAMALLMKNVAVSESKESSSTSRGLLSRAVQHAMRDGTIDSAVRTKINESAVVVSMMAGKAAHAVQQPRRMTQHQYEKKQNRKSRKNSTAAKSHRASIKPRSFGSSNDHNVRMVGPRTRELRAESSIGNSNNNTSTVIASALEATSSSTSSLTSPYPADPDIHFLTNDTFHNFVTTSTADTKYKAVFVNFFLWFCKSSCSSATMNRKNHPISSPSWRQFASTVRSLQLPIKIAALDCLSHMDFCIAQGVTKFPRYRWYYSTSTTTSSSSSGLGNGGDRNSNNKGGPAIHSVDFSYNKTMDAFMQFAEERLGKIK